MATRTDIHRPAAIQTDEYDFVGCDHIKINGLGDALAAQEERRIIRAHFDRTGGKFSGHAHGGNCHVCGNAKAIYTMVFWHQPTNVYIRVGQDCADKMDCGPEAFRRMSVLRDGVAAVRAAKAGKAKAQLILAEASLEQAWAIYTSDADQGREGDILREMVGKPVQYGSLSEKQLAFLGRLVDQIARRPEIEAQRAAEAELAAPVPVTSERMVIRGELLAIRSNDFGVKMLVRTAEGYKLWGSVPTGLADVAEKGLQVQFSAAVKPSDNDPKFGFFSRPTKAQVVA